MCLINIPVGEALWIALTQDCSFADFFHNIHECRSVQHSHKLWISNQEAEPGHIGFTKQGVAM